MSAELVWLTELLLFRLFQAGLWMWVFPHRATFIQKYFYGCFHTFQIKTVWYGISFRSDGEDYFLISLSCYRVLQDYWLSEVTSGVMKQVFHLCDITTQHVHNQHLLTNQLPGKWCHHSCKSPGGSRVLLDIKFLMFVVRSNFLSVECEQWSTSLEMLLGWWWELLFFTAHNFHGQNCKCR